STKQHINNPLNTTDFKSYPLHFQPIFKERFWGGNKLQSLGKKLPGNNIGESWEISMIDTDVNIITDGVFQGTSLAALIDLRANAILGAYLYQKYSRQVPLLFKFLYAKTDLSIQVHPSDELAKKRHSPIGKADLWYIMQADENARII